MNAIQPIKTIIISCTLLFADICLYGFFEQPLIYTLLAYSLAYLLTSNSIIQLIIVISALAVESTLFYGQSSLMLLYALPLMLVGRIMVEMINEPLLVYVMMIAGGIVAQLYLINPYFLERAPALPFYTTLSIAATLIPSIIFFLKFQKR